MKILAIETATDACSAALWQDGEVISRFEDEARKHSQYVLPMLDELLAEANLSLGQLDALAFGAGPGSFTGVRIATGVIQGAAFAADLPVVPVSTLTALAQGAFREHGVTRTVSVFDARMKEIYWNLCELDDQNIMRQVIADALNYPADLVVDGDFVAVGEGWKSYEDDLINRLQPQIIQTLSDQDCHAKDVAQLAVVDFNDGKAVSPEQALPVYLREDVAKKSQKVNLLA